MVDEYQDTNRSQYELMRLLTEERGNIAVVGDEDQSIYGWRGANIRNILDFERDFPGATIIRLEQNYRSTKNILEAASAVVANNTERIGKWLWTESGRGRKDHAVRSSRCRKTKRCGSPTRSKPRCAQNPNDRVAVLYRTNSQSRQIEEALRRYGRKYIVVGGFSFYQRAEVKDILAYLKVLVSPQDSISLLRIINTPRAASAAPPWSRSSNTRCNTNWRCGRRSARCSRNAFSPPAPKRRLSAFHRMIDGAGVAGRHAAHRRYSARRAGTHRLSQDARRREHRGSRRRVWRIWTNLLNAAVDAGERGETIRDFLDHAALVSDADSNDERAPVSLLTMHNAKGLEFPVVFIAGLEEGLFPHSRSLDSESAMEEERRLCYVGMTRAEKKLYLTLGALSPPLRRRTAGSRPSARDS